jgi:hypothetical protein
MVSYFLGGTLGSVLGSWAWALGLRVWGAASRRRAGALMDARGQGGRKSQPGLVSIQTQTGDNRENRGPLSFVSVAAVISCSTFAVGSLVGLPVPAAAAAAMTTSSAAAHAMSA